MAFVVCLVIIWAVMRASRGSSVPKTPENERKTDEHIAVVLPTIDGDK